MALHPEEWKRHFPEEAPAVWDPIWRDLQENEDWRRDLFEHSQDLLCVHDLEGRFLAINPLPARLLGYSVEEMLGTPMRDFIDPQFLEQFNAYLREIEHTGEAHGLLALVTRSGERRIWEYHNTLRTEGVETPIVRGIAHDVTDRMRAQKALRASNEQLLATSRAQERMLHDLTLFRTLLDQSNDAIKVIDLETLRFVDVNERACLQLGYTREELLSMTPCDIDSVADQNFRDQIEQLARKSGFAILEKTYRRKDGTTFPVEVNLRVVRLDRDYAVSIARDITARKQSEDRLREFERVVESMEEMIVVVDRDYRFIIVNRSFLNYRGMTKEQVVGHLAIEIVHPSVFETIVKPRLDECLSGKVVTFEMKYHYPQRGERDLLITYLPVEGPTGIDRIASVMRDITDRKRAEEALRTSEREQHKIAEQLETERARLIEAQAVAKVGSWETELPSLNITWSEETHRIFETDPSSFHPTRSSFVEFIHPEDRAKVDVAFKASLENGAPSTVEYRIVMAEGRVKVLEEHWTVFQDGQGQPARLVGTCQDITERKRAEEALRQSEERFRVALKNSPIAVFQQDQDLRYTWMYNSQLPWSASEKLGRTAGELFEPAQAARIMEVQRRVLESGVGARDEIQVTCEGRKQYLMTTVEPLLDATGAVVGVTGASMDVTELRETTEALREAKKKLTEEKLYLEQEIDTALGFEEIIGRSKALQRVLEHVGKVAASNATVLLLGETGTGKELVARAIHRLSLRSDSTFIKMNCAAIPSGLLESELFGNEKGAFTGAVSKKIGRIELADKGTLFLDEIGEISLALQPKLLRVLQDQEFERLGGTQTIKVDFRLIAATNRDLADSVREKEFRSDLYYRLNVFPIRVPPLRERREDIPLLVEHFVRKFARRMNRLITIIPKKTMDALIAWEWPGNVRELENFIERSVILTHGSVLVMPLSELRPATVDAKAVDDSLSAVEREHILHALRQSRGQIGGQKGAAMRLGLKRTTLQSKLKHLGINPRQGPLESH
jgi:PAS domain S-box-containing protein